MKQLSLDFVLVPLTRHVRTKIKSAACDGFHVTLNTGSRIVTALVPGWVVGKGTSFIRGWLKAGG